MAGIGNKVRLKSGVVGVIQQVNNGNYLLLTAEGKPQWASPEDIEEVL